MTTVSLSEYERKTVDGLNQSVAFRLGESKALTVEIGAKPGQYILSAAQYVGVVATDDAQVTVTPKVSVTQLMRMIISTARDPWLDEIGSLKASDDTIEAIAGALLIAIDRAFREGVLQGYRTVEEPSAVLRGRLRIGDQISRRAAVMQPLEITFDDFTEDIAENQILATAVRLLLRMPTVSPRHRRSLLRVDRRLAMIASLRDQKLVPKISFNRLNLRYALAIRLAKLILESTGSLVNQGTSPTTSFLINMNSLFEGFVTEVLESHCRMGIEVRKQYTTTLDITGRLMLRPDIVWTRALKPVAVADIKYKSLASKQLPNADIYQSLAYATALGLPRAHLIYAKGNEFPTTHILKHGDVAVVVHAIDLDQPIDALKSSIRSIGEEIVAKSMLLRSGHALTNAGAVS